MALDEKNKKKHTQQNYNYIILLKMSFPLQCFQRRFTCKEEIPPSVSVIPATEIISQSQQTAGWAANTELVFDKDGSAYIYSQLLWMETNSNLTSCPFVPACGLTVYLPEGFCRAGGANPVSQHRSVWTQ